MKFDKSKTIKKSNNKKISGVCGGIAEYFEIDPSIVRLIYLVLTLATSFFPGVIIYIIAAFILPNETDAPVSNDDINNMKSANVNSSENTSGSTASGNAPHTDDEFNSYFDEKK